MNHIQDNDNLSNDEQQKENIKSDRRDFAKLVGVGCGVACACYAGYKIVDYMAPSQDAKAEATIEVSIAGLNEGEMKKVKWRGKPIFIKKRTAAEIKEAEEVKMSELRDPQTDDQRILSGHKDILVVVGICTHLGCVPIGDSGSNGEYDGWFCPCHGSHYDTAGRVRKGPAPKNLEVPPYRFLNPTTILIGEKDKTALASNEQDDEEKFLM